ncbi:MAG: hypothetical protein H0T78_01785 [Longispora sp.]|nr:hypothetical protein [Longispora sp. (in: high G+C Gram-positive bacteria)]
MESLPEAQETLRDLLEHMRGKRERTSNAYTAFREVWATDTQPSSRALADAREKAKRAAREVTEALSFEAPEREALFTSAYTTFTDALDMAGDTYVDARETFDGTTDSYEGATADAIELDVMEALRQQVRDVGAEEAARLELLSPLDDDTRQLIQDTAATSLDAAEHMFAALAAPLEVYRTQAARIGDARRTFHDATADLAPTD